VTSYSTYPDDALLSRRGFSMSGQCGIQISVNTRTARTSRLRSRMTRYGIAYTGLAYRTPEVKPLAIGADDAVG